MTKDQKNNCKFCLEVFEKIILTFSLVFIAWSTVENYKLRKNSEEEKILEFRPYMGITQDPNPYTVINFSKNIAYNVIQISKLNGQIFIINNQFSPGVIAPGQSYHFDKTQAVVITSEELKRQIPSISKFVDYIVKQETVYLGVVYEEDRKSVV